MLPLVYVVVNVVGFDFNAHGFVVVRCCHHRFVVISQLLREVAVMGVKAVCEFYS